MRLHWANALSLSLQKILREQAAPQQLDRAPLHSVCTVLAAE